MLLKRQILWRLTLLGLQYLSGPNFSISGLGPWVIAKLVNCDNNYTYIKLTYIHITYVVSISGKRHSVGN